MVTGGDRGRLVTGSSRRRFAEVVRAPAVDLALACLLLGVEVDTDLDVEAELRRLDQLAADAWPLIAGTTTPGEAAEGLRQALGAGAGFSGSGPDYALLRSSLLHEVLVRRHGLPILLSVVWLEVARRLGVPAYGVGLPGHFVVAIGSPGGDTQLVDPFAGGALLSLDDAGDRVRQTTGQALEPAHLAPWNPVDILLRVLGNIRVFAASRPDLLEGIRTRLWAVELSLLLPRHPLALRRERGTLLAQLGNFPTAADELETYADTVEEVEPDVADSARREARLARARLN